MINLKKFENFNEDNDNNIYNYDHKELEYYKQVYSRYWDDRLEEDFKKILSGHPIKITQYEDRNDVSENIVLPLKNRDGLLYYKAYVTPKEIQKNPTKYDFVSPIFRNRDTLDWVVVKVQEVENLDNNALGGLSVSLKNGGGTSLAYLFLVKYNTGI